MRPWVQASSSFWDFGEGSLRFPWGISFCHGWTYCATLQSVETYNQRDHPMAAWAIKSLPKVDATFALRGSKDQADNDGNWRVECLRSPSKSFFFSDCDRARVLVSLSISIRPYVCNEPRYSDSKKKSHARPQQVMVTLFWAVWAWLHWMPCHLVGDSIKKIWSIISYAILLSEKANCP
jgi:hypothetical protein